jgi:hypothetical protein
MKIHIFYNCGVSSVAFSFFDLIIATLICAVVALVGVAAGASLDVSSDVVSVVALVDFVALAGLATNLSFMYFTMNAFSASLNVSFIVIESFPSLLRDSDSIGAKVALAMLIVFCALRVTVKPALRRPTLVVYDNFRLFGFSIPLGVRRSCPSTM